MYGQNGTDGGQKSCIKRPEFYIFLGPLQALHPQKRGPLFTIWGLLLGHSSMTQTTKRRKTTKNSENIGNVGKNLDESQCLCHVSSPPPETTSGAV
jgi:hypothetical protein